MSKRGPKRVEKSCDGHFPRASCRLVGELLRLSDPVRTQHHPLLCAWHDGAGGETLGIGGFAALAAALSGAGLRSAAALLAARTRQTLAAGLAHLRTELDAGALFHPRVLAPL